MSAKPLPIIIQVTNPSAFSGQGSHIVLESMGQAAAVRIAKRIARATGRCVIVRDARLDLIEAIPAAKIH